MIRLSPAGTNSATAYNLTYEIIERLTKTYCVNATIQPIVTTTFTVSNTELVGTSMYATIQCLVTVAYQPKNGSTTTLTTNTFVENFTVSFAGATSTSTIALTDTDGYTDPTYINCNNCNHAQGIRNVGTINIAFTA